jgi:adenine-specific DNA-methyltransferase
MATRDDLKLPLTSRDVHAERLSQFRTLFPEAFSEGKTDLQKLAQLLGDAATDAPERYGLSWSGKSEAIRAIQITSPGTLLPCPEESWPPLPFAAEPPQGLGLRQSYAALAPETGAASEKRQRTGAVQDAGATIGTGPSFNASENLIIEGDNLEVLKLLQGGYHGRVKMIYIDPPYNTGGEFIYPDNYKEGLADYLKFSGQVSGEGIKLTTNAETDGRYHSKWLTMMYPRLFLARNLLRRDGAIVVSIDEHEIHDLRLVMNEIFGEENFVAAVSLLCNPKGRSQDKHFATNHEYLLVFSKEPLPKGAFSIAKDEDQIETEYPETDEGGKFRLLELRNTHREFGKHNRRNLFYPLFANEEGEVFLNQAEGLHKVLPVWDDGFEGCWTWERAKAEKDLDYLVAQKISGRWKIYRKSYASGADRMLKTILVDKSFYTERGQKEFNALFNTKEKVFQSPKSPFLLQEMIHAITDKDSIILDFFAGSGTTAQAVLELNAQDGGSRKFILVQLPEPTERKDFPTIADITKERARRVIKKLETELTAKNAENTKESESELPLADAESMRSLRLEQDLGFKVFKLGSSNFKVWDAASAPKDGAGLAEQLKLMAHNVEEGRPDDALLYELILKSNLLLTSNVASGRIGAQTFYDVADGTLAVCLARPITQETLRGIMERKPKGVICLDIAFAGNDQLKANTVLEMKAHGIEFHTA